MRYQREDGCRAWLTYGGFHPEPMIALMRSYGSCEAIYDAFRKQGGAALEPYATQKQIDSLSRQAEPQTMHEMMLAMQRWSMGIVSMEDEGYPESLLNIPDPPPLLFYRGDLQCLSGRCVAMIGSRRASRGSLSAAYSIARELSGAGVRIVSGLAMGIDTAALKGGLEGGSPVIGVLGCGLDVDYPAANRELKEKIITSGGVLLSEYPPGDSALPWHFPIRNRIMSGLSSAVLMMEAQVRSGSMTTVQHALDQGKEVYAYPGESGTEWAEGAHQLLREGANYFSRARDVLEDLGWLPDEATTPSKALQDNSLPPMTPQQAQVYQALRRGALSYEQLAEETGMAPSALSGTLTMLQVMGLVESLPGKIYQTARSR